MRTHSKETQSSLTPQAALQILKEGNQRFVNNLKANRNLLQQVNETSAGQFPFATILSCIDSRTSAELIFDQSCRNQGVSRTRPYEMWSHRRCLQSRRNGKFDHIAQQNPTSNIS